MNILYAIYGILESMNGTPQDPIRQGGPGVVQRKWGEALGAGFQVVPNVLIQDQNRLGLGTRSRLALVST
jgi:hypothetical protein